MVSGDIFNTVLQVVLTIRSVQKAPERYMSWFCKLCSLQQTSLHVKTQNLALKM